MTITPVKKNEFLRALGAQRLPKISLPVVQALVVEYLNSTLGIAFAGYDRYAAASGSKPRTVERTIPALHRQGVLKKRSRRNGPPVIWFPELMDMDAAEAVRRAEWMVRHKGEDPSHYFTPGSAKVGGSGSAKVGGHNPISSNPSLRSGAPPQSTIRGSRLSDDWRPSPADLDYAASRGLTKDQIDTEAVKFRNHWTAKADKGAIKLNWARTWENWVIRATEYGFRNGNDKRPQTVIHWASKDGTWLPSLGPPPDYAGCKAPQDVLQRYGFLGKAAAS